MTIANHPQTDGKTERKNKVVEEVMRNLIAETYRTLG
jgi:alpha/beta superfamily hydrolase